MERAEPRGGRRSVRGGDDLERNGREVYAVFTIGRRLSAIRHPRLECRCRARQVCFALVPVVVWMEWFCTPVDCFVLISIASVLRAQPSASERSFLFSVVLQTVLSRNRLYEETWRVRLTVSSGIDIVVYFCRHTRAFAVTVCMSHDRGLVEIEN